MFAALGRFCVRRRVAILVCYAVLIPIAAWFGGPVLRMLKSGGFEDPGAESWMVRDALVRDLGVGVADIIALYTNPSGNVDDIEMLTGVLGALEKIEKDPDVVRVLSYYTTGGAPLVSKDRTRTFVVVTLKGDEQYKAEAYLRLKKDFAVEGIGLDFAGFVPVNESLYSTIEKDLRDAEFLAFPITAVLLLVIFGSGVSASMPLILGGLAMALAFLAMRIILVFTDLSIFAANVVTVLGLGLAIDYSLFIVSRYREELPALGVERAIEKTIATTGRAVAFSGVTVAASLFGLFVFPQMYLHSIALGGVAVTLGAVALGLTLLPAMLAVVGTRIDALKLPFSLTARPIDESTSIWHTVAFAVMKRPLLVAVGVTIPLLFLAVPFLRLDPSVPDHKILPVASSPRVTMEILDREFLAHQASPHDIIVRVPAESGIVLERGNLEALWELERTMRRISGVADVQGIFSGADIVGKERVIEILSKPRDQQDPNILAALDVFTRGGVVRFAAVSAHDFNAHESLAQVEALRALVAPSGWKIEVGGLAAILWDLKACIRENAKWMVLSVACVMFLVLFLVFGSLTLPIKAMIMNSLSLTASFGAMVWIFQDGRFTELLRYTPLGISDATQPILMFAVVFGLSMDYEVLLLTRVREEYVRTGDNTLSVARGLSRTGRLITSAAALLVVVIGAFATSEILFMKTLGVGMALAIALDATVIRALLVPAAMRLMGDWNWWAPAPLVRLWEKAGLSDLEGHGDEATPPVTDREEHS
jgi:trehalose monomycolate/heme transporter